MDKFVARKGFIQVLTLNGRSKKTKDNYLRYFDRFIDWIEKETEISDLDDLTYFHVYDFLEWVDSLDKYAPKTYNIFVYSLRNFYGGVICRQVDKYKFPIKKEKSDPKPYFTPKQVQALIEGCSHDLQLKAAIALACGAGRRVHEVTNLQFKNFNKTLAEFEVKDTKGNKSRWVSLSPNVAKILREYCESINVTHPKSSAYLFPDKKKPELPAKTSALTPRFQKYVQTFGFYREGLTFHSLRHAYATNLSMQGVPLPRIAQLMGHTSVATTANYIHLPDDSEDELPDCLDFSKVK